MILRIILVATLLWTINGYSQYQLDANFGTEGVLVFDGMDYGATDEIAIFQGKTVSTSFYQNSGGGSAYRAITVLNTDGSFDSNFGTNGIFKDEAPFSYNSPAGILATNEHIYSVSSAIKVGEERLNITITKLDANGQLVTDFGIDGYVTLPEFENSVASDGTAIAILPDGKLIVTGRISNTTTGRDRIMAARLLHDGTLDPTFGMDGIYLHPHTPAFLQSVEAILISTDGFIFLVGNLTNTNYESSLIVIKLTAEGFIDDSFGVDGKYIATRSGDNMIDDAVILEDGSILLWGLTGKSSEGLGGLVKKITYDGMLDTTFGSGGYGDGYFNGVDYIINYAQMILQGNKYLFIGDVLDLGPFTRQIILTQLNADGSFDTDFGENGNLFFGVPTAYTGLRGLDAVTIDNELFIASELMLPMGLIKPGLTKLISDNLSVEEHTKAGPVRLYPNPLSQHSVIEFDSTENQEGLLKVINALGQTESKRIVKIQAGENIISLENEFNQISNGVYFISLKTQAQPIKSFKVIK